MAAVLLSAALLAAAPARADFADGVRAYEAGNYADAYAYWLPIAEKNDVAAMRNIGHLHRWGQGVDKDIQKAMDWYRRAAELGFSRAQANLAAIYLQGEEGVPVNYEEAHKWFAAAAIQGLAVAQYNLGLMFELGLGVEKSEPRALGWYNLAAKAGQAEALERLSQLVKKSETPLVSGINLASPQAAATDSRTENRATGPEPASAEAAPAMPQPATIASPVETPAADKPAEGPAAEAEAVVEKPAEPDRPGLLSRFYSAISSGGGASIPDIFGANDDKSEKAGPEEAKPEPAGKDRP